MAIADPRRDFINPPRAWVPKVRTVTPHLSEHYVGVSVADMMGSLEAYHQPGEGLVREDELRPSPYHRRFPLYGGGSAFSTPELTAEAIDKLFESLPDTLDLDDPDSELPQAGVIEEARRIFDLVADQLPTDTAIYVMDAGKVVIDLHGPLKHGLLLVCEPGGSALCVVVVSGVSRRARYEDSSVLPDGFLLEGLRDVLLTARRHRSLRRYFGTLRAGSNIQFAQAVDDWAHVLTYNYNPR